MLNLPQQCFDLTFPTCTGSIIYIFLLFCHTGNKQSQECQGVLIGDDPHPVSSSHSSVYLQTSIPAVNIPSDGGL